MEVETNISQPEFDLAIVGAGPAGSAAAITDARLGARVVLFEARSFSRHKVCGEFISAEALGTVSGLLRDIPAAEAIFRAAPVIQRTRLLLGRRLIDAPVSPAGLSIARYDLDSLLWEAAKRAGVDARCDCEVVSIGGNGPFTVKTSSGTHSAKSLIIAAGRWSQFTPDRKVPRGPKWIGLKAHFREATPARSTDLYFFENGYCGVQPVADNVVNACAMVRSDRATSLEQVFALHSMLAQRAASWQLIMPAVSTAPLVYRRPQAVVGNVLHAGDAAAFIDPFVGDGISIALRSGCLAARCLQEFWTGEVRLEDAAAVYEREYRRQFAPLVTAASRIRWLLSLPRLARSAAFELMRLPGLMPYVIRKTREAA